MACMYLQIATVTGRCGFGCPERIMKVQQDVLQPVTGKQAKEDVAMTSIAITSRRELDARESDFGIAPFCIRVWYGNCFSNNVLKLSLEIFIRLDRAVLQGSNIGFTVMPARRGSCDQAHHVETGEVPCLALAKRTGSESCYDYIPEF